MPLLRAQKSFCGGDPFGTGPAWSNGSGHIVQPAASRHAAHETIAPVARRCVRAPMLSAVLPDGLPVSADRPT
ncbi:MAG: hypothetical protein EBR28_05875, partial [Planctomycetia bacterium]|nr:hypothetical protein [Planctomycetia bacterium]